MPIRKAEAVWTGTLREGAGTMKVGSGYFDVPFTFGSRFEEDKGTNPEELVGAAEAGCFSMFLAAQLAKEKFRPSGFIRSLTSISGTARPLPRSSCGRRSKRRESTGPNFRSWSISPKRTVRSPKP